MKNKILIKFREQNSILPFFFFLIYKTKWHPLIYSVEDFLYHITHAI